MDADQTTLTVLRPTPRKPNQTAPAPVAYTGVVADVQPTTDPPLDVQSMPGVLDPSKYVWYHIFVTLDDNPQFTKLPDIRNSDQLQDPNETDFITNAPALYHIKRAAPWWGDHIEIYAQRLASTPA